MARACYQNLSHISLGKIKPPTPKKKKRKFVVTDKPIAVVKNRSRKPVLHLKLERR